jgi:hypothetical protein
MRDLSLISKAFIAAIALLGAVVLVNGLLHWSSSKPLELTALLVITLIASRFRVRLPRVNGTMSVNVPFLLIVAVMLSTGEALMVAAMASLFQSIPNTKRNTMLVQSVFNCATITNAVAAAALVFHFASHRGLPVSLAIAAAGAAFFITNTIPMALVLWLAEGEDPIKMWINMARLSSPYYVLSAGVAAIVCAASRFSLWGLGLALLPLMYSIYTSYRIYFAVPAGAEEQSPAAKPMGRATVGTTSSTTAIVN